MATASQSKLGSLVETALNTAIGFVVAILSQALVFPLVGIDVPLSTNFEIGAWFTLISVARGYIIRRYFNARLTKLANHIAGNK